MSHKQAEVMGEAIRPPRLDWIGAAQLQARLFQEAHQQLIAPVPHRVVAAVSIQPLLAEAEGRLKPCNQRNGFRARPQAPFLASPPDAGLQLHPFSHQQSPHSTGALNFVRRQAEQIHRKEVHRNGPVAKDLHRIHMQQNTGLAAQTANRLNGLNGADLALAPDHRHQARGRFQPALQLLQIEAALAIHRQQLELPTTPLQGLCGRPRGGVLHSGDQQPRPRCPTLQGRCSA